MGLPGFNFLFLCDEAQPSASKTTADTRIATFNSLMLKINPFLIDM